MSLFSTLLLTKVFRTGITSDNMIKMSVTVKCKVLIPNKFTVSLDLLKKKNPAHYILH